MPRKKEFDVDAVLDKAMRAFWKYGYQPTSLNDLLDCMQIQRASLYNAFGDKRTLFLETLRRYDFVYHRPPLTKRMKTASPRQAIVALFQDRVTLEQEKDVRYGCFLVNTALELSPHDPEVAEIVNTALTYMEKQFFRRLIEKGRVRGEIARSVKPVPTARALTSLFIGMVVLSRSRPEKRLLQSIANQAEILLPLVEKAAQPVLSASPAHPVAAGQRKP